MELAILLYMLFCGKFEESKFHARFIYKNKNLSVDINNTRIRKIYILVV